MKTKDLDQALEYLVSLVDAGAEYPDAHWLTIKYFHLAVAQGEALTNLYDECGGISK